MLILEIHYGTGDVERRELSKTLPVSIGRHVTNDVAIDEEGVGVLHCRISWNGTAFEAVAAGRDGVDVNGSLVRHAALRAGDVLRIGSADLEIHDGNRAHPDDHVAELDIDLKPITSDAIPLRFAPLPPRTLPKSAPSNPAPAPPPRVEEVIPPIVVEPEPWSEPIRRPAKPEPRDTTAPRLGGPARPGEQDLLRSPLILGLGGGVLALVLIALTLWFIIGRESSNRQYDLALSEIREHRYSQGIQSLEAFLHDHPHHRRAHEGRRVLAEARIEQSLAGAAPSWNQAFERLEGYINSQRNEPDFKELQPRVQSFAERIGVGSAEAAASNRKRELLEVSAAASRVLQGYAPEGDERKRALQRVAAASRKAETELTRFETHASALEQIDAAIGRKATLEALRIRRRLIDDYPEFRSDQELQKRMQSILKLERESITRTTPETAATKGDQVSDPRALTFVRHTRARTDVATSKTPVFFVAGDTCFACDSATGEPLWRRVIGLDPPFAPIPVSIDVLALLLWDSRTDDLVLVRQSTGEAIWRQHVGARAVGAPAIDAGQILLSADGGQLLQLDLINGQLNAGLKFAQKISTPAVLSDNRAVVAAESAILYALQTRPLECTATVYSGHAPGSVQAPLLRMGDFLLIAENDREKSAQLSVWNFTPKATSTRFASARVDGHVHDTPVLRGKQLFVPATGERIFAFTVAEEADQRALTRVAHYQVEDGAGGPMYLHAGPDDEFWMAASSLRRFKLASDRIVPLGGRLQLGISAAPPRAIDQELFLTIQNASSRASALISVDRQRMVGQWQSLAAARWLAFTDPGSGSTISGVTDRGDIFSANAAQIEAGGLDYKSATSLSLPEGLRAPPEAVRWPDGRIALLTGAPQPRLFVISRDGRQEQNVQLPGELEAPPVPLAGGILLPLPGRLRLQRGDASGKRVEDYLLPAEGDEPAHWRAVLPIDDKQALVATTSGRLALVQLRTEPSPHLFEISSRELGKTLDFPLVLAGDTVFVATGDEILQLDPRSLVTQAMQKVEQPVSRPLWVVEQRLFAAVGRDRVACFQTEPFAATWTLPLQNGSAMADAPLESAAGACVLAQQDGAVLFVKADTGELIRTTHMGRAIVSGPYRLGDVLFVATVDGSLQSISQKAGGDQ